MKDKHLQDRGDLHDQDVHGGAHAGENTEDHEIFASCHTCNNELETCVCVCPFCGERDRCECVLFDAATGG